VIGKNPVGKKAQYAGGDGCSRASSNSSDQERHRRGPLQEGRPAQARSHHIAMSVKAWAMTVASRLWIGSDEGRRHDGGAVQRRGQGQA
jgi:hypothetical protein